MDLANGGKPISRNSVSSRVSITFGFHCASAAVIGLEELTTVITSPFGATSAAAAHGDHLPHQPGTA